MSASSLFPQPERSSTFVPRTLVRRATLDDAARISRLFAASFARDPVFHWLARGGRGRADALQRFFFWVMQERAIPQGETWMTSDGYAAAAWIPPFNAARPDNWRDEIRLLSVILSLTGIARLPRGAAMAKAMEHAHPPEPYFYLAFIGVAPRFQGTGLGQGLLEETLARVDAAGTPAFLENSSPRNIPLYERLGFRVTREIVVRRDAPPLYAMLRPGKNQ
ncbi:MAG: putative puromycin N-acetyltransferase [Pseudomonadota bacterium]|jgi:ribosomal protein S18 acetylase RimI-like enzyme